MSEKPRPSERARQFKAWMANMSTNTKRVAEKADVPYTTLASFVQGGTQNLKGNNEEKIADAFGLTTGEIFGGKSTHDAGRQDRTVTLPIRYKVAAGAWAAVEDWQQDALGEYEGAHFIERYEGIPQWIERVEGDSYNRKIPEGAYVHVVDAIKLEYEPTHGNTVIVERTRFQGASLERSIKQVVRTPFGFELWPRSYNPDWDQPLRFDCGDEDEDIEVRIVGVVVKAYLDLDQ